MGWSPIRRLTSNCKAVLLTGLVIVSFVLSSFGYRHIESTESTRIAVAASILIFMYILMIFELTNRNLAAMIGASMSIAAYDCLVEFADMEEILTWQDLETLSLLFGMMIIANVLGDTGLFDYLAVWSYEKSKGRFWLLITTMAFITGFLSAFIDNVSCMLLMSPTIIKISELEQIDPRYILMMMVVFCNIGGCATPVGDPPNLIIIGDQLVNSLGITFGSFCSYCGPCVLICMFATLMYFKLVYGTKESFKFKPTTHRPEIQQHTGLENESISLPMQVESSDPISELNDCLDSLDKSVINGDASIENQLNELNKRYKAVTEQLRLNRLDSQNLTQNVAETSQTRRTSICVGLQLDELKETYKIKDKTLLIQSSVILVVAVLLFFIQSLPDVNLTLGWVSIFAGLTLLVVSSSTRAKQSKPDQENDDEEDEDNFDSIITRIEWTTLIFFFSLFIVMRVMSNLGLIRFIGSQIGRLVTQIPSGSLRSIGAISIVLWASGIASACIDNVPFASMMIKIIGSMFIQAREAEPGSLSLEPLVFALAFGACLGGNGTLIGASANLVTAGISGRFGYKISFNSFSKFTSTITILTLLISNIYLIVVFVWLDL